ncbi:MAG: SAM-dependent methyltransferase [Deltaproteobacteria bacterium]|nr:SAM-dependent methyltransferase [Deltaproteobacteria bacterium]
MAQFNWTAQSLLQQNQEIWKTFAIQTATKLDIITIVDKRGGATIGEIAEDAICDPRATEMLVVALVALELLAWDGEKIVATEAAKKNLSSLSASYIGNVIMHMSQVAESWVKLSQAVKTGKRVPPPSFPTEAEQKAYEAERAKNFILGMYNVASLQAEGISEAFLELKGKKKLLDLGGGPGTYAAFFCAKNPELQAVVFDRPTSEPLALGVLERLKVTGKVSFMGGDFLHDPLPKGFDVVWLSQVLHGEDKKNALLLVQRAAGSLEQGGILAIQEFVLDDKLTGPVGPALFALNMLVNTEAGRAYTYSEIIAMMNDAGVAEIKELKAPLPPGNRIFYGIKGQA